MPRTSTKSRISRKTLTILVATAFVLGGGGVAFAYWTSTGAGTGSGTTAAGTENLVVNQTSTIAEMGPGVAAQTLSGTFDNPRRRARSTSRP